jgi:hypothetical protein
MIEGGTEKTTEVPLDEYIERRKVLVENQNRVVRTPIGRLSKNLGKVHKGKAKKYTPKRMINAINKFFQQCEDRDVLPTIKALTLFLNLSPGMFYTYKQYPDFEEIMDAAYIMISDWIERDIYNTPGQAASKISYAKNLLGWADKLETKNETEIKTVMSTDSALHLIQSLAPQLLEQLDDKRTVDAMGGTDDSVDAEIVEDK